MSSVRFENVTFRYELAPKTPALIDASFTLDPGTLTILTGTGGSGKSTICRLIAGYAPHQFRGTLDGTVLVNELDVGRCSIGEIAEHVGTVFENPFDQLTGISRNLFDEVAFGLENRGVDRDEIIERVLDALHKVGLGAIYDRHPRSLSGGQSQRLAVATVLALRPSIIVLDDPTSQLDPVGSIEVAELVTSMLDESMTILVVAHDIRLWLPIATNIMCLKEGRLEYDGKPHTIIEKTLEDRFFIPPPTITVWKQLRESNILSRESPPAFTVGELADQIKGTTKHD